MIKKVSILCIAIFSSILMFCNPASLDTSFNGTGYVLESLNPMINQNSLNGLAIQTDGKIIAAGTTNNDSGKAAIILARYLTNGDLDPDFGTKGIVTTLINNNTALGSHVAIDSEGRIIVVGYIANWELCVVRYLSDGSLDSYANNPTSPFGNITPASAPGYAILSILDTRIYGLGISLDASENILVMGYTLPNDSLRSLIVARYLTNGTLDATFGTTAGYTLTQNTGLSTTSGKTVSLQSDGKMIIAGAVDVTGNGDWQSVAVRYTADGIVDTAFGESGTGYVQFPSHSGATYFSFGRSTYIQSDNSIILAGQAGQAVETAQMMIVRYTADGILDLTFNQNDTPGYIITMPIYQSIPAIRSMFWGDVGLDLNNNIIVAGYASFETNINQIVLARYNANGTIDTDLSSTGYIITVIGDLTNSSQICSNIIEYNQKLIAVGESSGDDGYNNMITLRYLNGTASEQGTSEITAYGYNSEFISDFLYQTFYATIITDIIAQAATLAAVNTIIDNYISDYSLQQNFNFIAYLYLIESDLNTTQATLIATYPNSTIEINKFFAYLENRIAKLVQS